MTTPQVYILTLLAVRREGATMREGAAAATSALTIQPSFAAAQAEGKRTSAETYPAAEGWFGHQVTVVALPSSLETDGYTLTYTITDTGGHP